MAEAFFSILKREELSHNRYDSAEFSVGEDAKLSFAIKSDDSVKLTVFTLSETAKGWKQNILATKTLKTKNGKVITETTAEFDVAAGGETRYFYSVQSLNAKKGKAGATYALSVDLFNGMKVIHLGVEKELVSVADAAALAMPETASVASALAMPETDSHADSLAMPDSLSIGQYDTDVLADTSLDPASDKLFGESGNGLLASL